MKSAIHERLLRHTNHLRKELSQFTTETIVGMVCNEFFEVFNTPGWNTDLVSPLRQLFFLLSLMLTTPEPKDGKEFGREEFDSAIVSLNRIFNAYAEMYWPTESEISTLPKEWRGQRLVAMGAFLHYFNTHIGASPAQIKSLIGRYHVPFDEHLRNKLGISATKILQITEEIHKHLQGKMDELIASSVAARAEHRRLVEEGENRDWTNEEFLKQARQSQEAIATTARLHMALSNFMKVDFSQLSSDIDTSEVEAYKILFLSKRDVGTKFTYLTETIPGLLSPLFELPDGLAMVPAGNALYSAAFEKGELTLQVDQKFLDRRGFLFEGEVSEIFTKMFPESARFIRNVYETPYRQQEHDLIILCNNHIFVVECKAGGLREPFRDPEKAFIRIRDDFKAQTGIQHAYDQANRIANHLKIAPTMDLFDGDGEHVVTLKRDQTVHCICVTREDYGHLAVNLSLLLEKDGKADYPWCIEALDLRLISEAWEHLGLGDEEFIEYLDGRQKLQGRLITNEELEIAGLFLKHQTFIPMIESEYRFLIPDFSYSDIFDRITMARDRGEEIDNTKIDMNFVEIAPRVARVSPKK